MAEPLRGYRFGITVCLASAASILVSNASRLPTVLHAQDQARPPLPPDRAERPIALPGDPGPNDLAGAGRPALKAVASFEGVATPGSRVGLTAEGSSPGHVRWVQVQGSTVELDDPTGRTPTLTIPAESGPLAFLLFVANESGTQSARVAIPVVAAPSRPSGVGLRADAGDDQIGMVGRQITLNGSRSGPRPRIGFRWLQVEGPRVRLALDEGPIYSFVPQAPGIYQFALVVAEDTAISNPDLVTVSVGNPASPYGIEATPAAPEAIHDVARAALSTVPGGIEVAEPLAEAFDGIADRMGLYRSYSEAANELGRRLESLVPADATRRAVWDERLFVPLTARLIEGLRPSGLDLRVASSQSSEISSDQRARFAELFRAMARGFRSTQPGLSARP